MSRSLAISIVSLSLTSCVIYREEAPATPSAKATAPRPEPAPADAANKKRAQEKPDATDDVNVVKVKRKQENAPKRTTPTPPPERKAKGKTTKGDRTGIRVACNFEKGFVSILPATVYDPGEEYLMQALIGLTEEPTFWRGMSEYAKLEPFRAVRCQSPGQTFELAPGKYVIAVGMAGQFSVKGEYRDNGFLSEVEIADGEVHQVKLQVADLKHTWKCISCPYLVVFRDGERVEVGQVLVDRYTRRRYGTDVVSTEAEVVDGVLVVRLEEREPEVSLIDAVSVRVGDETLAPLRRTPKAMRAIDDDAEALRFGEAVELRFDARGFADGPLTVEIAVSGHYEPIGPLL